MSPRRHGGGRISFRVAIVTVVVGLLLATCGFLIAYVLYRGQQSVDVLKRDYLTQVAESTVRGVSRLPETAAQVLRVQRFRLEHGLYPTTDAVHLARILAAALRADSDIQWVSYGEQATGRFMGGNRLRGQEFVLNISDPRRDRGRPRELRADTLTPHVRTTPLPETYDPRTRPWYRAAAADPEAIVWLPPYDFAEGVTGITAATAVRDRSQRILGVVTVDFALAGIDRFLEGIDVPGGGTVVLFDRGRAVLAGAGGPGREAALRAASAWTPADRTDGGVHRADVKVDGETWAVAVRSFRHGTGLEWMVAVAVPDRAFMGAVHENRRAAIVIALTGLTLAVLLGIVISTAITRSLGSATAALDRIARFELAAPALPRSSLREIYRLQDAVRRVSASLRSFSRYAPEEIVRDIAVSGREAILSGERRDVSVLFSDLRGFTSFAERTRPEEVVAILNDHFELQVGIIVRHRGFVVDFLGDCVFAVFGAPTPDAGHVERAVACAIEMQRARDVRNADHRGRGWPPLEMGVGIDTGPAVVGNMGALRRIKYGVVGHIVNVAARIETFTVGGQILVSDATRRALGDRLVVDSPLEVEGKGVGAAMQLWEVLALRGEHMLVLPSPVRDLASVEPAVDASLRLVHGKQIDRRAHPARLHRLGASGAELEADAPLAVFGALQVLLPIRTAAATVLAVDAKVIALSERAGARTVLVRFTGVDWDTRARIDAFAGRGGAAPNGEPDGS